MKIFLNAYLDKNFGDDLFVYLILNRYKESKFYAITYQKSYLKYDNLKMYRFNIVIRGINKIIKILSKNRIDLFSIIANKKDIAITIGGSMFMENDNSFKVLYYNNFRVPYYIIGTNVGPYKSKNYIQFLKDNIFANAKDICFRDEKSYNLYKGLKNVRYAPDLLFSLDLSQFEQDNNIGKKVIISVIDVEKKKSQIKNANAELYEKLIINMIHYFKKKSYIVELISFCEDEGDPVAIEKIKSKCKEEVNTFYYNANIPETIYELSTATTIVGTRFHANILGFLLKKNVIPIIYNDKTKNMLEDIDYKGVYFDINNPTKLDIATLTTKDLEYKINVEKQIKDADKHFAKIDKVLKREFENERK